MSINPYANKPKKKRTPRPSSRIESGSPPEWVKLSTSCTSGDWAQDDKWSSLGSVAGDGLSEPLCDAARDALMSLAAYGLHYRHRQLAGADVVRYATPEACAALAHLFPPIKSIGVHGIVPGDLLLRTFDALHRPAGLRRIAVLPTGKWAKIQPAGEPMGGRVLRSGPAGAACTVVVEGESDFLTWSALRSEWCVIGLFNGAWRDEISIAQGHVFLMTDCDKAGDRYAAEVANSLSSKHQVWRYCGLTMNDITPDMVMDSLFSDYVSDNEKMLDQRDLFMIGVIDEVRSIKGIIKPHVASDLTFFQSREPKKPVNITPESTERRRVKIEEMIESFCAAAVDGAYDGDRSEAMRLLRPIAEAAKDGAVNFSKVANRIKGVYLSPTRADHMQGRVDIINELFFNR